MIKVSVIVIDEVVDGVHIHNPPMVYRSTERAVKAFENFKNYAKIYSKDKNYRYDEGETFVSTHDSNDESRNHYMVTLYKDYYISE